MRPLIQDHLTYFDDIFYVSPLDDRLMFFEREYEC
jgi:hypothetical protein